MILAIAEATMIAILHCSIISFVSKASIVMKMLIVKPIPANILTAPICFQVSPLGSLQSPKMHDRRLNSKIPNGFPITSPVIIPILSIDVKSLFQFELMVIQVFANAKRGIIIIATG